jgi:hypothetical protein
LSGAFLIACVLAAAASAAEERSEPVASVGAEASFSIAPFDHGYFNTTDYSHSVMRMARLSLSLELRAGSRAALLVEGVSENLDQRVHALYVRLQPTGLLSLQAGLIPPVFGSFPRRAYGYDNVLISFPLPYQYLSTLRSDAVPLVPSDLLANRGRGWWVDYPSDTSGPAPGLPLVSAARWDTGGEISVGSEAVQLAAAVTTGSLSRPRVSNDNDGWQLSGRLRVQPNPGLVLGVSGARGEYVHEDAVAGLPQELRGRYFQEAFGLDAEYSWGYWLVRGELVATRWDVPEAEPPASFGRLQSLGYYLETRYRVAPGVSVAARVDHVAYDEIAGPVVRDTWDANVTRVEAGVAWTFRRHATLKAVYQQNWRDSLRAPRKGYVGAQLVLWY